MLEVSHLSKRFGSIQALDSLSLTVGDNELVGFVGANGAGKSTTMRIIMGVLAADAGTVTWRGTTLDADARRRIGYMPEERGLYPKMKVGEQLTYLARLHGVEASSARRASDEWTERLSIEERRGDDVQKLSLGNQQRVQLAAALVGSPDAAQEAARAVLAGVPGLDVSGAPSETGTRLTLVAGGPDEQRLLRAAENLGRLRELGPVRRPLAEVFREALAAPADLTITTEQEA